MAAATQSLWSALICGQPMGVRRSLAVDGVDIEQKRGATECTPLLEAVCTGDAVVVTLLLKAKADVSARDNRGATALHWASAQGSAQVVHALLKTGSDVSAMDNDQDTALHAAASKGHTLVICKLLANGADPSAKNNDGMTPRESAKRRGHKEVARLLFALGGTAKENSATVRSRLINAAKALGGAAKETPATVRSRLINAAKAKTRSVAFGGQHQPSSNQTWVPELDRVPELECGPEGWCCGHVGADRRG
jgi:ankyrin repeat protein